MRVKGSIFVHFVKAIRVGNKTGTFDTFLTDEDREIIKQKILPNVWYPYETFKHCLQAFYEVVANKNLETIKAWGRMYSELVMPTMYEAILQQGDPLALMKRIGVFERNFFNFGAAVMVVESDTQATYTVTDLDPQFPPIHYMILGYVERALELCGAENLVATIVTKSWEGAPNTSVRLAWTLKK